MKKRLLFTLFVVIVSFLLISCKPTAQTDPICDSGYTLNDGQCVKDAVVDPICDPGYVVKDGKCVKETVKDPVCDSGYMVEDGKCVEDEAFVIDFKMSSFVFPEDVTKISESFDLPKALDDVSLTWELESVSNYLTLTSGTTAVNATVVPIAYGDLDQVVTINLTATYKNATKTYSYDLTLKSRTLPISEFYKANDLAEVVIGGVVYAKARVGMYGYYVFDKSGSVFVYQLADDVNIGDEVVITGSKVVYFNMHQVTYTSADNVSIISSDNPLPDYESMDISEIVKLPGNYTSLAQDITFQAKVIKKLEDFMTNFYFEDIITGDQVFVYYKSAQDIAGLYEGKYVEVKATVHDYNSSTGKWSVFLSNNVNDIKEVNPTLTDEQKASSVDFYLKDMYEKKVFSADIDLKLTDTLWSSTISWTTDNLDVVGITGLVVLPSESTKVVLTATIVVGTATLEKSYNITILPIPLDSLKDITKWQLENKTLSKEVSFEAIVVENRGSSGYFVSQNGYGYYVKGNDLNLQAGDKVRIIGTTQYSRQPFITETRTTTLVSSGNQLPSPMVYSAETFAAQTADSSFYNAYVTLTGTLKGKPGSYGYTYTLKVGDSTVTIHSASNVAGLAYILDSEVQMTCFINRINSDTVTWEVFLMNREGDVVTQETDQGKLAIALNFLDLQMATDQIITTDLRLPQMNDIVSDINFTYTSSHPLVLSNDGKYLNPSVDTPVVLTVVANANGLTQTRTYNLTVKHTDPEYASDLMFTFLLHGITNDKIFSIYNGTGQVVDLSTYTILAVQNAGVGGNQYTIDGANAAGKLKLSGTLGIDETLVIYHAGANVVIINQIPGSVAKISSPNQNGVAQFNGKDGDTLILQRGSVIIDQIGSFERINSLGQQASYETEFFGKKMLIRSVLTPTPLLNWSNFAEVYAYWDVFAASEAPDYLLPSIAWDYMNGVRPIVSE